MALEEKPPRPDPPARNDHRVSAGTLPRMLLTQEGLRALHHFRIGAAPQYDEQWNRIEGNDGLRLSCAHAEEHGFSGCESRWEKQWPGHVAAPTIRDLALVAERHYNDAHRVDEPKTGEAEAPEKAVTQ